MSFVIGGNVLCLDLWGRNSGPFMQALHFSFGLGAFVAPLLAAPFLEPSSIDVLPTAIASTAVSFQSTEMRGKREALPYENITDILLDQQWLDSSTKSLDNISATSDHSAVSPEFPIDSTSRIIEMNSSKGLEISTPTIKPIFTTQRTPKPKPQKIDPEYYHVKKSTHKEDHTTTLSTVRSILQTSTTSETTDALATSTEDTYSTASHPALSTFNNFETVQPTLKNEDVGFPNTSNPYSRFADISSTSESLISISALKMLRSNDSTVNKESFPKFNSNSAEDKKTSINLFPVQKEKKNMDLKQINPSSKNNTIITSGESTTPESTQMVDYTVKKASLVRENDLFIESTTEKSGSIVQEGEEYGGQSTTSSIYSSWTENDEIITTENLLPKHVHHKPLTYDNDTEVINSFFDIIANRIEKYGFSKVQFTYLMVGLFVFAISLVFLGFLCHNPRDPKSKQEEGQGTKKISNKALHGLLISLMAIFFLLYVGLEVTYGQLVLTFAVNGDLQLARSTGLVIAVVFWGSFAAMRFASIFFSSGFGPITMLLLNFVFCTMGTILLSSMASHTETALWVGTALLGIGLASVFPTGILWIERYIHVSNKVAAAFVMGASLGEMICPVAVYHLMVNDPAMLMYSAVVINILCILTFIALRWLALRHGEKYCAASNNGYQLANQDEEEDMIDMSPSGSVMALRRHSFSSEHRALLNGNPHRGP